MEKEKIQALEENIHTRYQNIVGLVVMKNNKPVYENYFNNHSANNRVHVYSVTKSIMSILIGIAIDKGYIHDVNQKILDFFPEYSTKKDKKMLSDITLKNLITMTTPYKYKLFPPYIKYFTSKDWVKFSLHQLGGRGKIGKFQYAPLIGPDILSAILTKATNQSVLEFARENLFNPLNIKVEKSITFHNKEEQLAFSQAMDISGWVSDANNINAGGWGLTLSTLEMARIGLLYLNHGLWEGKQIVSSQWIDESTKEHSRWKKYNLPYGYLWWLSTDHENSFAAMGDGGNIIYINNDRQLVIAMTATFLPNIKDRIELIKRDIEPLF